MSLKPVINEWTGRRVGLVAALFFLFGNLIPVFKGYETYNGLEIALLLLNDDGTILYGWFLLAAVACAIGFGLSCIFMAGRGGIASLTLFFLIQTALFITVWIANRWTLLEGGWVCVIGLGVEAAAVGITGLSSLSDLQTKNKKP